MRHDDPADSHPLDRGAKGRDPRPALPPGSVDATLRHALSIGDRTPGEAEVRCRAALEALRALLARMERTTPYAIAHDTDLEALIRLRPTDTDAVRHVGVLPAETAAHHAEAFARVMAWFLGPETEARHGADAV